jgi:hypothetical protein
MINLHQSPTVSIDSHHHESIRAWWQHRDLRGMTTGDPPHRYHNIDCIGRRHKPLAPLVLLCCYQVVIGYNMWWPPHYMGGTCYWCPTQTQLIPIHTYYNTESYRNSTQKHSTGYEIVAGRVDGTSRWRYCRVWANTNNTQRAIIYKTRFIARRHDLLGATLISGINPTNNKNSCYMCHPTLSRSTALEAWHPCTQVHMYVC